MNGQFTFRNHIYTEVLPQWQSVAFHQLVSAGDNSTKCFLPLTNVKVTLTQYVEVNLIS